jgi:hypothetical protein
MAKLTKLLQLAIQDINDCRNPKQMEIQNAISMRLIALALEEIAENGVVIKTDHPIEVAKFEI